VNALERIRLASQLRLEGAQQAAKMKAFPADVTERYLGRLSSARNAKAALAFWKSNIGIGGPLGQFNPLTRGERATLDFYLSGIGRNFAKTEGGGGANLTEIEITVFGGAFPLIGDYTTTLSQKLTSADAYFTERIEDMERAYPELRNLRGGFSSGPVVDSAGETDLGEIDDALLGGP
jgi:hypothetical protein